MSDARVRLGRFGERLAAAHLESKGYTILDRNFRCPDGEINVIAQKADCLVFVEVRTRRGDAMGSAAESVTPLKCARLAAAAEAFCQEHPEAAPERRIDVVAVDLAPDGRLLRLEHIENVASADELPALPRH